MAVALAPGLEAEGEDPTEASGEEEEEENHPRNGAENRYFELFMLEYFITLLLSRL